MLLALGGCQRGCDRAATEGTAPTEASTPRACSYGAPAEGCEPGTVCAHVERDQPARCVPFATEDTPLQVPFATGRPFWVGQRGRSPEGRTHSWKNDLFAVDFAPPLTAPEETVVAPLGGEARVFDGCEERDAGPGQHPASPCGLGYGNHVRIWDGQNLVLLAHFARITARDGRVERGQPLGLAGSSGQAGYRHVHLTVSRLPPGRSLAEILGHPGWAGGIPVRVRYPITDGGATRALWSDELPTDEEQRSPGWLVP